MDNPVSDIVVNLEITERLAPYPTGQRLYYSVSYKGKVVLLDSPFGLDFKGMSPFAEGLTLQNERKSTVDDTWEPVWGTHSRIRNQSNELSVTLAETNSPGRKLEFIVRAYDNGIWLSLEELIEL